MNNNRIYSIVERVKAKSQIYVQSGRSYFVVKRSTKLNKTYMKCTSSSKKKGCCPGRGYLREGGNCIILYKKHECTRNPLIGEIHQAREAAFKLAMDEPEMKPAAIMDKIREIFSAEVMGHPDLSRQTLNSTIKRLRKKHLPKLPESFEEFQKLLEGSKYYSETLDGGQFFRKVLTDDSKSYHCVVFYSDRAVKLLKKEDCTMEVDGTFKTMPEILSLYQLVTLINVHNGVALPAVFILMSRKTEESYVHALKYVKESIEFSPKEIISDSETALLNALHEVFPDSAKTSCYFHYTKAVVLKALTLGLKKEALKTDDGKRILGCILALPLLPADRIEKGFKIMSQMIIDEEVFEFGALLTYVHKTWINRVGVEVLSVFQKIHRTTNMVESYHSLFKDSHPNLWKFIAILLNLEKKAATEAIIIRSGKMVRDNRRRAYIVNEGNQIRNENDLLTNRIDELHFLERGQYQVKSLMSQLLGSNQAEAEDDDLIGFPAMVREGNLKHANVVKPVPGYVRLTPNGCVRVDGTGLIRVPASAVRQTPLAPKRGSASAHLGDQALAPASKRGKASAPASKCSRALALAPAIRQVLKHLPAPTVARTSSEKRVVVRIPVPAQASSAVTIIAPSRSKSSALRRMEEAQEDDPDIADIVKNEEDRLRVQGKYSYIFEAAKVLLECESSLNLKELVMLPSIISGIPLGKISKDRHLTFLCKNPEDFSTLLNALQTFNVRIGCLSSVEDSLPLAT